MCPSMNKPVKNAQITMSTLNYQAYTCRLFILGMSTYHSLIKGTGGGERGGREVGSGNRSAEAQTARPRRQEERSRHQPPRASSESESKLKRILFIKGNPFFIIVLCTDNIIGIRNAAAIYAQGLKPGQLPPPPTKSRAIPP